MTNYTNEEKVILGKLFGYYRKKEKIAYKKITSTISAGTYYKIEKGMPLKNSTYYDEILDFFGIQFTNHIELFNIWKDSFIINFCETLENFEEERFREIKDEFEKELEPYKSEIIYQQYYQVLSYIINYYIDSKYMNKEEIEDMLLLIDYFELEELLYIFIRSNVYFKQQLCM